MGEWEWFSDPEPGAPDVVDRALAAPGIRDLMHGMTTVRLTDRDIPGTLETEQQVCWRRYRLSVVTTAGPPPFDGFIESQAFPVMRFEGEEAVSADVTACNGRLFGEALLEEAHKRIHRVTAPSV